jgi:biopolymer transport protein ExbB
MRIAHHPVKKSFVKLLFLGLFSLLSFATSAHAWWNPEWTIRKKMTLDPAPAGMAAGDAPTSAVILVRLHEGNFNFDAVREDHSDLRFVAADDKTLLPYHVESYNGDLQEAFVWVKVPEIKGGAPTTFWLYYGNAGPNALRAEDSKATYDADTVLVYHFAEKAAPPKDFTGNANNAETAATAVEGSLIGSGLRLTGKNAVTLPKTPSLAWSAGQAML